MAENHTGDPVEARRTMALINIALVFAALLTALRWGTAIWSRVFGGSGPSTVAAAAPTILLIAVVAVRRLAKHTLDVDDV